ncbi:MAG: hypothetical protein ABI760_19745 [Ferruginibacter sp.]
MKIFAFILLTIAFGCRKEYSFENHDARGSLKDSAGICFAQSIHGTFYNGITPGTDTAYIEVKVNVIKAGTYSIFTDTQNGLRFADSGVFTNVGINIINLRPGGTPINHVPANFTLRFDTSICSLSVNVSDSEVLHQNTIPDTVLPYNWKFTDTKRGVTYRGLFENNYILTFGTLAVVVLSTREAKAPGDSTFLINISFPTGSITTGIYTTDETPTGIVFRSFNEACGNCAGGGLIPISSGALVTIKVTDYDPATKIIKGTFSGTTIDWFNEIANITQGEFTAHVN